MTNNEKVKQAITNNMASIYSALEQVGATLPEKKNLENVSLSINSLQEKISLNESLAILQATSFIDATLIGISSIDIEEYLNILNKISPIMKFHITGD